MSLFSGIEVPRAIGIPESSYALVEQGASSVGLSPEACFVNGPRLISFLGANIRDSGHSPDFSHGLASDQEIEYLFDMPSLLKRLEDKDKKSKLVARELGLGELPVQRLVEIEDDDINNIQHATYFYQSNARDLIRLGVAMTIEIIRGQNKGLTYVISHDKKSWIDCEIS